MAPWQEPSNDVTEAGRVKLAFPMPFSGVVNGAAMRAVRVTLCAKSSLSEELLRSTLASPGECCMTTPLAARRFTRSIWALMVFTEVLSREDVAGRTFPETEIIVRASSRLTLLPFLPSARPSSIVVASMRVLVLYEDALAVKD